eukprot:c13554_g1_i1 orf=151-1635(-)
MAGTPTHANRVANFCVVALIMAFSFWIRILVSFHPYSGAGSPPRFGDYEAQRHWMEITLHTPIKEWYRNTTNNDLQYWGLDYPPLTAYQSLLHGLYMHALEPESVDLNTSHGYETPSSKFLMRWTVLLSDAFLFFPASLCFIMAYYYKQMTKELAWALAMILLQPALILIDHGHFQYNCISLGLSIGATAAIISGKDGLGSVLFCLALNHKQMSAYFAPAFFGHLFGKSIRCHSPFFAVLKLSLAVIVTFAACWWPFLYSKESAFMVLTRLAPLQRGIYEDYVANFWCGSSLIIKWKQMFSPVTLAYLAMAATVFAFIPCVMEQILSPSRKGFLFAMLNSSFAFYLFSYQVHEKSILLPLLPASLLALEEPQLYKLMTSCAMFSMFPLLRRDGLVIPYFALSFLFFLLANWPMLGQRKEHNLANRLTIWHFMELYIFLVGFILILAYMVLPTPTRYPYIFEACITAFMSVHLVIFMVYANLKQWSISYGKEKVN